VRITVDLAEIRHRPQAACSPRHQPSDIGDLNARLTQLESEIARLEVEKQCLAACAASHRADFERERERCETLMTETLKLGGVAMSAREKAARLEAELAGRRGGSWKPPIWQQKAAGELPAHGRKAPSPVLVGVPVRA
jgi:hypothetical protein